MRARITLFLETLLITALDFLRGWFSDGEPIQQTSFEARLPFKDEICQSCGLDPYEQQREDLQNEQISLGHSKAE